MNKLEDWKNRLKKGHMLSVICVLLIVVAILGAIIYKKQREYRQASENSYNMAFYELVDYVQNVEAYLCVLLIVVAILGAIIYKKQREYRQASENSYNMAFYELVDYVQNVEAYLAKSMISTTSEHGAETLTNLWREANLAQSYLSMLPIESQELENTEKFLNQVSDYSYSLSRKNIYNENLTDDELANLEELHGYSVELENTLNQLSEDLNTGRFKWEN